MGVQLPRWAWVGAGVLASVAGRVAAGGFPGFQHPAVTPLTGGLPRLPALTGAFLAGAVVGGFDFARPGDAVPCQPATSTGLVGVRYAASRHWLAPSDAKA